MSTQSHAFESSIANYVHQMSQKREPDIFARLRAETAQLEWGLMQISVEQGRLMEMLVQVLGAKKTIEVGVFTGYSSLCVALKLPEDGKLVACDVSEEWTSMARRYWEEAGVADRIDLRIAPATESLQAMIDAGEAGDYDFAFIDADKGNYPTYYEQCLQLVRAGGIVALDNAFMGGRVADPETEHEGAIAIRQASERVFADERVDASLVPVGDGLLLARKR